MKIGFIGTGNMGTAIIKGYLMAQPGCESNIFAFDSNPDKLDSLSRELGIQGCGSIGELVEHADVIVLSVKPNIFEQILPQVSDFYRPDKTIVSIAAGVSIGFIESYIKASEAKVIRVMPNTPAMVNEGMAAICKNKNITEKDLQHVISLFRAIGKAEVVDEKLIDAVTGVSGSSPAYTYMFIEALVDGAVKNGMSKEQATIFAAQSVLGAAKMVLETGVDPVILRENVCSPGGTTIEAVKALQNNGFHNNVVEALDAVVAKSKLMTK